MDRALAATRNLKLTDPLELRLIPDEGLHFDEEIDPQWIDAQLEEDRTHSGLVFERTGPIRGTLDVEALGPVGTRPPVNLRGQLLAPLATHCVRCTTELRQTFEAPIELTLLAATAPRAEGEALDESCYAGDKIDLPSIVREALLLALSDDPTCEDEPACDARTAALLAIANGPAEALAATKIDPRWEALRSLVVVPPVDDE